MQNLFIQQLSRGLDLSIILWFKGRDRRGREREKESRLSITYLDVALKFVTQTTEPLLSLRHRTSLDGAQDSVSICRHLL